MGTTLTRKYELTYLLPGSLTDSEIAQARTEIEALLKKNTAQVVQNEDWGRKQLAYILKSGGQKHHDAIYTHLVLEMPAEKASLLDHDVLLSAKVIRHLLVVAEEHVAPAEDNKAGE